ncbi:hypothetical protein TPY_0495 [Sulfobacillus acidophilus TPY]|nr:hypothetical protein TPY_0495 [Sulfobacillus acidophilus TPY]
MAVPLPVRHHGPPLWEVVYWMVLNSVRLLVLGAWLPVL